ncbi:MAG: hypothetical protein KDD29_05795, partial [Flavobacteriales bacterium]|nr:hypothetical protein [Flavobacteriales bacterium]
FAGFIEELYFKKLEPTYIYHYLPFRYLKNILENNNPTIRLYNLSKYVKNKNDSKEYSYFIDRIGLIIPNAENYLNSIIEDMFILSCTTEKNSDDHWNYYGKKEASCICFNLEIKKSNHDVDLKNVVYESELTKLFCLNQCLKEEIGYSLDISKVYSFSKYVKRSYYEWEKEIRICFDNNSHQIGKKLKSFLTNGKITQSKNDKYFKIKVDETNNKYIEIPLENDFFKLTVKSIHTRTNNEELKRLCNNKEIELIIESNF